VLSEHYTTVVILTIKRRTLTARTREQQQSVCSTDTSPLKHMHKNCCPILIQWCCILWRTLLVIYPGPEPADTSTQEAPWT